MKLASLRSGGRDGTLVLVDRDLKRALPVPDIARTLQDALDNWDKAQQALQKASDALNAGTAAGAIDFASQDVAAPLPRAYQWCDGSAYLSHAELVRKARKAEMPQSLYSDPLVYQGGSDTMLGARDDIRVADESWGIDLEAEIAIITSDVPMATKAANASQYIRLVLLVNDVSLRNLIPSEIAKQFGFFQSKPPTAFSLVAVTPDELGDAWDGRKVSLPLISHVNGTLLGKPDGGVDLNFDFPQLIEHITKTRPLGAGAIIGSGTVSNRDPQAGSACLAERRMIEIIADDVVKTPFLAFGDAVRIEMLDKQGKSIFGAIEQKVVRYTA
jgi:fumarylacetoacetate (FAA) hydrolase